MIFGLQHYALVGSFTSYLEDLLITAPSSREKIWIAKVLVDEYGEGSQGRDHAELYREFLAASGAQPGAEFRTGLHADVVNFVKEHERLCRAEPFLVGFGAVGPGHEWGIPAMFEPIVRGLRRVGFTEEEISYFTLHQEQDVDHGNWLEEALVCCVRSSEEMGLVRTGTMASLDARARFWDAVQARIEGAMERERGSDLDGSGAVVFEDLRRVTRVVGSRSV